MVHTIRTNRTAERLRPFGTTVFAEITALAREHGAVNLGQGFPDFEGPDFVKDAAARALRDEPNQYAPTNGVPALTAAIARDWGARTGLEVDPGSGVTVTAGATEAIAASLLGMLDPGDEVVLFEPFYDSYRAGVRLANAEPRFVTLRWPEFRLEESALREAVTDRTRAILLNTPHNPTGRVFSSEELDAVARVAAERDLVVISDEVYERLALEGEHMSIAARPGMAERTITISSLGKTFSLTGWKVGWAIAPAGLSAAVRSAHQFLTFAVATPLQHAAAAALGHADDAFYADLRSTFRARRDLLVGAVRELGLDAAVPEGGYFVIAEHAPLGCADDVACVRALIERAGVAAIPPSFFYARSDEGKRLIRLAFCKREETLREAASRLAAFGAGSGT